MPVLAALTPASRTGLGWAGPQPGAEHPSLQKSLCRELVGVGLWLGCEMLAQVQTMDRRCKGGISFWVLAFFLKKEIATCPGPHCSATDLQSRE